jgi:excisionase family DNA binding protein
MQETAKQGKVFFNISEVARQLRVSRPLVQRMVDSGRLRTVRLNRRRLVHVREVERVERGE